MDIPTREELNAAVEQHAGQGRKVHVDGFREDRDDSIKRAVRLSCGTDRYLVDAVGGSPAFR